MANRTETVALTLSEMSKEDIMDRKAQAANMRAHMEQDVPESQRDTVVIKSKDRQLTSNQIMKEVEDGTELGDQLLKSFVDFQDDDVSLLPEGWEVVPVSLAPPFLQEEEGK